MDSASTPRKGRSPPPAPASGPPPLNYRVLALLWLVVSLPAVFLLAHDPAWLAAPPGVERLRALKIEQWVAGGILLIQLYLGLRAYLEWISRAPEPDRPPPEQKP